MKRGNLFGSFTFRENEHGKHVVMDYEEWRDLMGRLNTISATLHLVRLKLEPPVSSQEIHEVQEAIMSVINMEFDGEGFRERRRSERRSG